jgi:hypothetical protein
MDEGEEGKREDRKGEGEERVPGVYRRHSKGTHISFQNTLSNVSSCRSSSVTPPNITAIFLATHSAIVQPDLRVGAKASEGRFRRSHFAISKGGLALPAPPNFLEDDGGGGGAAAFLEEDEVGVGGGCVASGKESLDVEIR